MKDSKIEWTDHVRLSPEPFTPFKFAHISNALRLKVPQFVALVTKRNAVAHLKSEFWELGKRLDVMRSKIAAATITAILAFEAVSIKDRRPPKLILWNASVIQIAYRTTMLVIIMIPASWAAFTDDKRDFEFGFLLVLYSQSSSWLAFPCPAHFLFGFIAMLFALERGNTAAQRGVRIFGRPAVLADRCPTITPTIVHMECSKQLPLPAQTAVLFAMLNVLHIFRKGKSKTLRGDLHNANFTTHFRPL